MASSSTSGQGRPKGALNKSTNELKTLAQSFGPAAIMRLAELAGFAVDTKGNKLNGAMSEAVQHAAIKELLDRGYGKSVQPQSGPDGEGPIVSIMEYRWAAPAKE